jgi:hypothetical protein
VRAVRLFLQSIIRHVDFYPSQPSLECITDSFSIDLSRALEAALEVSLMQNRIHSQTPVITTALTPLPLPLPACIFLTLLASLHSSPTTHLFLPLVNRSLSVRMESASLLIERNSMREELENLRAQAALTAASHTAALEGEVLKRQHAERAKSALEDRMASVLSVLGANIEV